MSSQAQLTQLYLHQVMPLRQEVMYPGKPVEMARVDGDETAVHLGLTVDQQIVSVVSLFVSEKYDHSLQFRKLATLLAEQGKGYGTSLLNHVLAYAELQGFPVVWCNARLSAFNWYRKFGFQQEGSSWHKNGIEYIIMFKKI